LIKESNVKLTAAVISSFSLHQLSGIYGKEM